MSTLPFPDPPTINKTQPDLKKEAADISKITDTVSHLLDLAHCPARHRGFLDALLGAANGELEFFECSDLKLSDRLRPDHTHITSEDGRKKYVQRARTEFMEWQEGEKILLVEWEPGGQDRDGEKHCTRYRLPLLKVSAEVVAAAKKSTSWDMNDGGTYLQRYIRDKGMYAIHDLRKGIAKRDRFNRPRESAEKYIKSSLTYARKAAALSDDSQTLLLELAEHIRNLALGSNTEDVQICTPPSKKTDSCPLSIQEEYGQDLKQDTRGGAFSVLTRNAQTAGDSTTPAPCVSACAPAPYKSDNNGGQICTPSPDEALTALTAFELVEVNKFEIGFRNEEREARHSVETMESTKLRAVLPSLISRAASAGESFIVRPVAQNLVQLDDLSSEALELIKPFAFLAIETSPANFQAWVSLSVNGEERDLLRRRLIDGLGADRGASGALRWAGSLNYKPKHRRADGSFPAVRLLWFQYVSDISAAQLEMAGLLAPAQVVPVPACESVSSVSLKIPVRFPDYGRELSSVGGDRSKADMRWCLLALAWGWSRDAVENELRRVSEKARQHRSKKYVTNTLDAAVRWHSGLTSAVVT